MPFLKTSRVNYTCKYCGVQNDFRWEFGELIIIKKPIFIQLRALCRNFYPEFRKSSEGANHGPRFYRYRNRIDLVRCRNFTDKE